MRLYLPFFSSRFEHGGVAQFFTMLHEVIHTHYQDKIEFYDHDGLVKKSIESRSLSKAENMLRKIKLLYKMATFSRQLERCDHVLLNPSLGAASMKREMYYGERCHKSGKDFSIFLHGWNWDYCAALEKDTEKLQRYRKIMRSATAIFVLSSTFKEKLTEWGISADRIHCTRTMIPDSFLPASLPDMSKGPNRILFISRVTKEKGIIETVKSFKLHQRKYPESILTIAGDGPDLEQLEQYIAAESIPNIEFTGFVTGQAKIDLFKRHNIFILASYTEGMPISIFEAMAHGLTIITRPIGGIPDFFQQGKMGMLVESLTPEDYADCLAKLAKTPALRQEIGQFNHNYARNNVMATHLCTDVLQKSGLIPR